MTLLRLRVTIFVISNSLSWSKASFPVAPSHCLAKAFREIEARLLQNHHFSDKRS